MHLYVNCLQLRELHTGETITASLPRSATPQLRQSTWTAGLTTLLVQRLLTKVKNDPPWSQAPALTHPLLSTQDLLCSAVCSPLSTGRVWEEWLLQASVWVWMPPWQRSYDEKTAWCFLKSVQLEGTRSPFHDFAHLCFAQKHSTARTIHWDQGKQEVDPNFAIYLGDKALQKRN